MNLHPVTKTKNIHLQMERGDLQQVSAYPRGTTIVCERGVLWVTQPGDPGDHVLEPGQRYTLDKYGKVLIEAMSETTLSIVTPN